MVKKSGQHLWTNVGIYERLSKVFQGWALLQETTGFNTKHHH